MPMSDDVASLRSRIGTDFLLLPGVTAVIREGRCIDRVIRDVRDDL